MKLTHRFADMTPEKRPQDPHIDGIGLRFETMEHGGEYPDTTPQAIKGRVLHRHFVGPTFQGKGLNSLYAEVDPLNPEGKRQFGAGFAEFHHRHRVGTGIAGPVYLRGRTGFGGPAEKARGRTTPRQEQGAVRAEGNGLRIPVDGGMCDLAKNRHVLQLQRRLWLLNKRGHRAMLGA
jgi:hypothetical protein